MTGANIPTHIRRRRQRMMADRKGNSQCKAIFAMFARRKEGFPSGGSCRVKRLMRGDKSALTKNKHSLRTPLPNQARSRTLYRPRTSQSAQKLPCTATAVFKIEKNIADRNGGCRAGKFGEMREVWRGKDTLRKGVLPPPRSSLLPRTKA